jgi:hypothetical protein
MVRAYLAGLKTQTRRTRGLDLVNKNPDEWLLSSIKDGDTLRVHVFFKNRKEGHLCHLCRPPYGWAGDTLWFKETYAEICNWADPICPCESDEEEKENHYIEYRADTGNKYPGDWPEEEARGNPEAPKWKSSMFMKKIHSRFVDIPIANVRVERLQDISDSDALAEGINAIAEGVIFSSFRMGTGELSYAQFQYKNLWDKLNGKKLPWSMNPWVWVYEFSKYQETVIS